MRRLTDLEKAFREWDDDRLKREITHAKKTIVGGRLLTAADVQAVYKYIAALEKEQVRRDGTPQNHLRKGE